VRGPIEIFTNGSGATVVLPEEAGAAGPIVRDIASSRSINLNATGPQGEPGPVGQVGPQGPVGLQGARGLQGPSGVVGQAGAPGQAGRDGAPGQSGRDGAPGQAGGDGVAGLNGADGDDGLSACAVYMGIEEECTEEEMDDFVAAMLQDLVSPLSEEVVEHEDFINAVAAAVLPFILNNVTFINSLIESIKDQVFNLLRSDKKFKDDVAEAVKVEYFLNVDDMQDGILTCPNNQTITSLVVKDGALSVRCKDPSGNSSGGTPGTGNQGSGFDQTTVEEDEGEIDTESVDEGTTSGDKTNNGKK